MPATEMKSNVLVLTKDAEQQAKLRRKLEDYKQRYLYVAPEVDPAGAYRLRLLGELLEKQIVDVDAFAQECQANFGWHYEAVFKETVAIIVAYNSGDLTAIKPNSGTGLR